jgi:hypothetical protein
MATMTDEQLKDVIGVVALDEYRTAPDHAKPKLDAWFATLRDLSDEDFLREARSAIYSSAQVASWRGNWDAEHCKASACYHESCRRLVLAGHERDCRGVSLYSRAHSELMREHGYQPTADGECECSGVSL